MRLSPLRHTPAVLRTTIGYTQKEMAQLCHCSTPTIQAIELGKLALSGKLAGTIAVETGISEKWLLDDDVNSLIVSHDWTPYTKEYFERFRAKQLTSGGAVEDYMFTAYEFSYLTAMIADSLLEAHRIGDLRLLCFRLKREISATAKELLAKHRHLGSWIHNLDSHDRNKLPANTKPIANATIKKILDDFWQDLDSQFQKKKDHGSAASLKTVPKQLLARKTPKKN